MLCKRIIPCLDVRVGRVVKGTNFVGLQDAGDPVELAKRYNDDGADELCFLDITGSIEKRGLLLDMISQTAEQVFMPLTVGGGVQSLADIRALLNAGADKVTLNSAALKDPTLIRRASEAFGSQCIVVAIDAKAAKAAKQKQQIPNSWQVYSQGGRTNTGRDVMQWVTEIEQFGAGEVLLTSMDRDGTKSGYDLPLTRMVSKAVSIPVIASGGVGELEHLKQGLVEGGADAVLAASIFHYGHYSISQVKQYLYDQGLAIRLPL